MRWKRFKKLLFSWFLFQLVFNFYFYNIPLFYFQQLISTFRTKSGGSRLGPKTLDPKLTWLPHKIPPNHIESLFCYLCYSASWLKVLAPKAKQTIQVRWKDVGKENVWRFPYLKLNPFGWVWHCISSHQLCFVVKPMQSIRDQRPAGCGRVPR